ncbi:6-phosphogluconolactonase [Candidatus Latescibacterota bacterium]
MKQPLRTYTSDGRIFHIFASKDDLDDYAFELWMNAYNKSMRENGLFCAALSGGNTPAGFYRKIASNARSFQWDNVHLFLVDERFVPLDHENSNTRMIKENLVSTVSMEEKNFHFIPTDHDTSEAAALSYENHLKTFFALHGKQFPVFDMILLGIGGDGHTASLFPGTPSLSERSAFTAASISPVPPIDRITLTFPVINHSKKIVFIVTGENKSHAIEEIAKSEKPELPASNVLSTLGEVVFLLDESAGTLL